MKKIPTIFERDWNGDRSRVVDIPHKDCGWVFAGEGWPTQKLDGTCCLIRGGKLFKRRELRKGSAPPDGFEFVSFDEETGKTVGWMPVGDVPEDKWHREAFDAEFSQGGMPDGTYELVGPSVQGNPEKYPVHVLQSHNNLCNFDKDDVPRTFEALKSWLSEQDVEGIVFHHSDGRMGKIKKRDFGLKR